MKKRLLSFMLAIAASLGLAFGLAACDDGSSDPSDPPGTSQEGPEQGGDPEQGGGSEQGGNPEQGGEQGGDPEQGEETLPPTEGLEYTLSDDESY